MININIHNGGIDVSGHAVHAPPGQDIVCAAVSVLLQTLTASLDELTENKITYDIQSGKAVIRYKDLTEDGKLLVESFFIGASGIAASYPECVESINAQVKAAEVKRATGNTPKTYGAE